MNQTSNYTLVFASLLLGMSTTHGQVQYADGHADIGIAYENGDWDLHFHDEEAGGEFEPGEIFIYGSESNSNSFKFSAPGPGNFSFLGDSGDDVFIFPQVESADLPFLGIAAEEIDAGIFIGDITVSFAGFSGPGDFFLYQVDSFSNPNVIFDSTDGIGESLTISVGSHAHYNWAFTAEGVYTIGLSASGILNDGMGTFTQSPIAQYTFGVNAVPEPSSYALLVSLAVFCTIITKRRR